MERRAPTGNNKAAAIGWEEAVQDLAKQDATVDLRALIEESPLSPVQLTTFVLCGMIALLDGADTQSFAIAASSIARTFGMKVTEFGLAFAIAHLGACVGAMICGPLSDTIGRKVVLVGSALTFAVFTIATAFAGSYHALLAIRFCAGLGLGGAVPCFLALASEYAPASRRGTLASLLWAAYPLGGMVGGFAGAFVVAHYGWPMMFYLGGGLPILIALAMAAAMPESPAFLATRDSFSPRLRSIAERISRRHFVAGTRFAMAEKKVNMLPVRELFSGRRLPVTVALWVAFFGAFGMLTLVVSWVPAVLQGIGVSAASAAGVLGFFNLGAVVGMGVAGRMVDRFGIGAALVPALGVAAVVIWLLGAVDSTVQASVVMALIGLFLGCGASGLIAVASTFYETRMRGTGLGWSMAIGRFGQVLGPLLTGMLLVKGVAIGQLMQALAVVPIVVAIAVLLARAATGRAATIPAEAPQLPG